MTITNQKLIFNTADVAAIKAAFPDGEAMIYGFEYCRYLDVEKALKAAAINTYDDTLGIDHPSKLDICNNRQIYQIDSGGCTHENDSDHEHDIARSCKAGLVNMVLENYKSQQNGAPSVPIVFCIDTTPNPYPFNPVNVASKTIIDATRPPTLIPNKLMTHCELRRAYKLCHDKKIRADIQATAQKSFRFAKVEQVGTSQHLQITEIEAPWKAPTWNAAWATRKSHPTPAPNKQHNWRKEANHFARCQNLDATISAFMFI